jgi:predicted DNA-binding transcriptional regulator AlpA
MSIIQTGPKPGQHHCAFSEFDELPASALTSVRTIARYMGVGISTVWRYAQQDPDFPRPVKLSARCTRWRVGDIRSYLKARG